MLEYRKFILDNENPILEYEQLILMPGTFGNQFIFKT